MKKIIISTTLISIILFHLINNYIWLKLDCFCVYPENITNTVFHLDNQAKFYHELKTLLYSNSLFSEKLKSFVLFFRPHRIWPQYEWPGFVYFVTSLISLSFGTFPFITRFSSGLFLIILIIFTYLIGKACENKRAGLIASFLISFYPGVFGISRLYDLDFHLMAMLAMSIYFLINTKRFTNFKFSALLGLFSGLGILVQGRFAIFIIGPLLYMIYVSIRETVSLKNKSNLYRQIINVVIFLTISVSISSIWWLGNLMLLHKTLTHLLAGYFPDRYHLFGLTFNVFSPEALSFHLLYLIDHVSIGLFLIFSGSLLCLRKRINSNINIVLLWILVPLVIFTFVSAKWEHYCFSILPGIAIITAVGIERFVKKIKFATILFLIVLSLLQFFEISYAFNVGLLKKMFPNNPTPYFSRTYNVPFKKNNYEKIMREFAKDMKHNMEKMDIVDSNIRLGIIDVTGLQINAMLISYYARAYVDGINVMILPSDVPNLPPGKNPRIASEYFADNIKDLDFIILMNTDLSAHITVDNLCITENFLTESSYKKVLVNLLTQRIIIDRELLRPCQRNIFLLAKRTPVL